MWKFSAPVIPIRVEGTTLYPPTDPHVLGWWGQPAGSVHGTTLLTGHTVHTGGGTLDTLYKTPVGSIATVSGVKYRVTTVVMMPTAAVAKASATLFSQSGPPRLVVVTCDIRSYDWNTDKYADNTVITAIPV